MSLDFKTFFYDANILRLEIRILHYLKSIRDANTSLSIWCTACVELKSTNSESSNLFLLNDALHIAHTYTHQLIVLYNTVTIKRFSWFFKSKPIVCYQFNKVVLLVRPTIGTATKINCCHRISKETIRFYAVQEKCLVPLFFAIQCIFQRGCLRDPIVLAWNVTNKMWNCVSGAKTPTIQRANPRTTRKRERPKRLHQFIWWWWWCEKRRVWVKAHIFMLLLRSSVLYGGRYRFAYRVKEKKWSCKWARSSVLHD